MKKGIALGSGCDFIEREKSRLRVELRRRRNNVHKARCATAKIGLHNLFFGRFGGKLSGSTVAAYWPLKDEIDVRPILYELASQGVATALPIINENTPLQSFRRWFPGDELVDADFGVQEPHPRRTDAVPDLIIVPLLGFDAHGNRIGYGGGYYDRTLQSLRACGNVDAVGVGYKEQECAQIPTHPLDEPLDLILTDERVLIPSAKKRGNCRLNAYFDLR